MTNSGKRVYIIAEAGSNWRCGSHKRDLKMARTLIDIAADAGADAIKFQTYRAQTVYVPNAGESEYLAGSGIRDSIVSIFEDLSMPYEMIPELAAYCVAQDISFMSSPFSEKDAAAVDPYVHIHKIASYEITHIRLIEYLAATGKPLIMSTGAATVDEIRWAATHFKKSGGSTLTLMQCTAKYPAPLDSLNLNAIPAMHKLFGLPVGLSDHSRSPLIAPLAAVALGATVIEKHFTLHNQLPGPDHAFALTPGELTTMIAAIRDLELSLGSPEKAPSSDESELRAFAQRAIQACDVIRQGDILREGFNIAILRPGMQRKGLHPARISDIEGRKATRDIPLGDAILDGDFA